MRSQSGGRRRKDWSWQILITRRPQNTVYGGYWELPGGKIEPGETPRAALVREFQEELGLAIEPGEALDEVVYAYPHAKVRLRPFFCRRVALAGQDHPNQPRNLAVAEHRWVLPDQISQFRFPEANAPILTQMLALLASTACPPKAEIPDPLNSRVPHVDA